MCPLLWCRTSFPDLASTLHHVASCPWLSDAWYWCPTCCRPERFLEGQNTQKAFRQAPVQASRSKIKTFFRQLSRKKNQRPSSMPPFSSVDSFAYSSTPTADDTPERVELEDTPYEVRPAELETSRYYACAGPWIPVEKANTIYELDAHAYVAAPGPGSPTNYDGHVARHIYAVEEESKYRAGPPPYSLEDGGISDAQSVISYSPKDMLYSGSQALDSARSYNNGLATLPSAGEGELSASSSQRIDSRTRAPTWMLARQTSDDHQLLVGSMVATSQPPPGYHLALCSTQDFAGNPRLQVSEFFEAVAAMSQEWLQRLAFTTKFTPPCADTYARSLFELGVGVLRKLFSHAGSIPTSFRDVFALLHVSVASAYVMFKDDNSYSWSTLMDDAMQWQTLLSNDIERRTFVKVVSLLCQRSRSATSSPMQDSAVEDNFLPEESSVLLLMLGHFTSAAVGSFTDEDSSRLGRDSRGMESFHLFRASMVVKTCTSLLEGKSRIIVLLEMPLTRFSGSSVRSSCHYLRSSMPPG